jgi:class 3 adenylate cyclase
MANFKPKPSDYKRVEVDGRYRTVLAGEIFDQFNISLLRLGAIGKRATGLDVIAAVFDLRGFTNFCNRGNQHIVLPQFLSEFLEWLIAEIKHESSEKRISEGAVLWCKLPFFLKFTGDGIIALWDCEGMNEPGERNLIQSARSIVTTYKTDFVSRISRRIPDRLRTGQRHGLFSWRRGG